MNLELETLRRDLALATARAKVMTERAETAERDLAEANRRIGEQTATIKSLCDRLERIHRIATRSGPMRARLSEIEGYSGGFAQIPAR
jgi:hypothetical protein